MLNPNEPTGGDPTRQSIEAIPTGMETDPHADEEVISKSNVEDYPEPVQAEGESAKIAPDDLADSIAYALDGSGPGPTNATPNVSGHKMITEGTTGASLADEEDALRS